MVTPQLLRAVEDLRAQRKKKRAILQELRPRFPAFSEDEIRLAIELVPTARLRRTAAVPQRALLVVLSVALVFRLWSGLAVVFAGDPVGWVVLVPVAIYAWLLRGLWRFEYQALWGVFGLVLPSYLGLARMQGLGVIDVSALIAMLGLALWLRIVLFPNLNWRGRLKTAPE